MELMIGEVQEWATYIYVILVFIYFYINYTTSLLNLK